MNSMYKKMLILGLPISMLVTACGGSDGDDYQEVIIEQPPVVIDKNDPVLSDKIGRTEAVPYLSGNYFVDKVSRIALLDPSMLAQQNSYLIQDNVNLYRYPSNGVAFDDQTISTKDNSVGFLLVDDPELFYSAAASVLYDKNNREAIVTRSEIDETIGSYINKFKRRLGDDYSVVAEAPKSYNGFDGEMLNIKLVVTRKDGELGATKFPVINYKRIRDELISTQLQKPAWTTPVLKSTWGTSDAESEAVNVELTTWAYKGGVYLWTAAYDPNLKDTDFDRLAAENPDKSYPEASLENVAKVQSKYGRFNTGTSISSALHALAFNEGIDIDGNPVDADGNAIN
ncbi:MAG: hypothetical protein VYA60_04710 [Pseudomonadota bacterium]|nr:hypothetical protein [Pseudomonadota bacterium]